MKCLLLERIHIIDEFVGTNGYKKEKKKISDETDNWQKENKMDK